MVVDRWSSCLTKGDGQFARWCFKSSERYDENCINSHENLP